MALGPRSSTAYRQPRPATTSSRMLVIVLGWVSVMQTCLAGSLSSSSTSSSGGARSVQARIKTPWAGSSLVVQYLESLATEDRHLLHPFLTHLIHSNASALLTTSPTTSSSSSSSSSFSPSSASATAHDPSRTWAVLSHQLQHFLDQKYPSHSNALVESLGLAMGLKEASARLQAIEVVTKRAWASTTPPPPPPPGLVEAPPSECDNWVQLGGYRLCSVAEFWNVLGEEQRHAKGGLSLPNTGSDRPKLYPFDHLSPRPPTSTSTLTSTSAPPPLVIFYASPSSPAFIEWYELLTRLALEEPPRIEYVLRWKSAAGSTDEPLVLSGYGAGLDIKKSDYLAIDDRLTSGEAAHDPATDEPIESSEAIKMEPIKKKDIPLLGVRSTSYILSDPSPLSAFTRLTSSFPLLASKLSSLVPTVSIDLLQEIQTNSLLPTGLHPSFKLNGLLIPEAQVDPFVLVRLMRKERKFLTQLQHLLTNANEDDRPLFEISPFQARGIIMNPSISKAMKRGAKIITEPSGRVSSHVLGQLFDASDRDEGRGVVFWWNDLEKDKKYQSWGKDLRKLLQPNYPGQMNSVALNLNQAVFILDLTQPWTLQLLTRQVQNFVSRGIPIRFGLVPKLGQSGGQNGAESAEETLAKMFWYLTEAIGRGGTMRFLEQLLDTLHTDRVTTPHLRKTYETFMLANTHTSGGPLASFAQVLELPIGVERVNKARAYAKRLGVAGSDEPSSVGAFLINGAFFEFDEEWTQHLQQTLSAHVQYEQQEVYFGKLTSETDVENFFYDLPTTYKRRNQFVFTSEANPLKVVNLVEVLDGVERGFVEGTWIEAALSLEDEQGSELGEDLELDQVVSLHVVADLDSSDGRQLVHTALEYVQAHPEARVSLLHNPALDDEQEFPSRWAVSNLIYLLHANDELVELLPFELSRFVRLGINQTNIDDVSQLIASSWDDDNPIKKHIKLGTNHKKSMLAREWWTSTMVMAKRFGFERGQSGVVINGRVVGPLRKDDLTIADLETLVSYEREERIDAVVEALRSLDLDLRSLDRSSWAHMVALATSVIAQAYEVDPLGGLASEESIERSRDYLEFQAEHSAIIGPNEEEAMFEIAVVVDPATELAQRWAPIIETLSKLESVHLRVYLIPTMKNHQDLPIKRFYAFTFASSPQFDPSTGREQPPQVQFTDLPEDVLFTFAMDTPKAWLAFPKKSIHDLDNIRLKDLPPWARKAGVDAEFELENLVVEGHARETPGNTPPRGLQLELVKEGTGEEDQHRVDTIVMANLGYFQFKASPGPWRLAIREGKSSQVYSIETTGAEGWNSRSVEEAGDEILVTTFEGVTLFPRFKRNKGHEMTQLLDDTDKGVGTKGPQKSVVDRVKNLFLLRKSELTIKKKAEINVFTVASGLLYERMAFLMVVSVMRHTQSTVKFWFIQNFLSPSFRAFIPHLAKEYGFEYELVTYKWPHWLRAQTEKQRTIWGYKILFLDVLFPLELERVIFVDSDQIVRTDLKQLVDLDLQGAPYAYTPMGDDRAEMDRFRFWKSGYWRGESPLQSLVHDLNANSIILIPDHLRGKPYHISALYVVDLDRFRAMAAGDRLRQQYQGLSADPNSLANLDQDLPNNMQDQIPIYTLDQSWLWCETWCSDASLAQAKTIDLCNNPLTHEPKLRRAKRLIPEWTVYDDEVAALAKRVAAEQTQTGGMEKDEGVGVFSGKADELGQAKGQKEELDAFVKEKSDEGEKVELRPVGEHVQDTVVVPVKDEL